MPGSCYAQRLGCHRPAPSCPGVSSGLQPWARAISLPSFAQHLSSPSFLSPPGKPRFCLGEGSCPSSLGVPFTTMTVTDLLLHRPPAHQSSSLPQCPDLATAQPTPSPEHPASTSPSLDKVSFLQSPLLLTTPPCCVSGSFVISFLSAEASVGQGGTWVLGTRRLERQRAWGGGEHRSTAGPGPGPGRHSECVLAGGRSTFPGAHL